MAYAHRSFLVFSAAAALASTLACSSANAPIAPVGETSVALDAGTAIVSAIGNKCLDDSAAKTTNDNKIQIWTCNGTVAQEWSYTQGTFVGPGGKCLDIQADDQKPGTVVELYECNGTKAQEWTLDGTQIKSTAGLCLDVRSGLDENGAQVQVYGCNGSASQRWDVKGASSGSGSGSGKTSGSGSGSGSEKGSGSGSGSEKGSGSGSGSERGSGSGSGSDKGSGSGSGTGSGSGGADSAGCGHGSAGTTTVQIKDGSGANRPVKVIVPSTYNRAQAEHVTTVFGGYGEDWEVGTNGTDGYGYTGSNFESRPNPGIVVYPETTTVVVAKPDAGPLPPAWFGYGTYQHAWDDGYEPADFTDCTARDHTLYLNIKSYLEENYCVDPKHESVAGFSWGGDFVVSLVCCHSDVINAAAVASATDEYKTETPAFNEYSRTCKSAPGAFETAIRFTHDASLADSAYPAPAFEATHQLFLYWNFDAYDGTGVTTAPVDDGARASCIHYSKSGKMSVDDCGYTNLGHSVPTQAAGFAQDWSTDTVAWFNSR